MKAKTVITVVLLGFVVASVVYLVVKETRGRPVLSATQEDPQAANETGELPAARKVVVYYFHGNVRCMTCRTIEAYTREAVEAGFAEALKDGRLEWRIVNVDEGVNEHFVRDFELVTRSVVLERLTGGRRTDWKNLPRIWELARGDKEAFLKYVRDETRLYLEAADQ